MDSKSVELVKTAAQKKKDFIKTQNECYLCGNHLNIHVEYISFTRFAVERAQCGHCMTLVRVQNHSIQ